MMTYERIDEKLYSWAAKNGISIEMEDSDISRRFIHVSSVEGETFQIVFEPEIDGCARVDAHLIENFELQEVHYVWEAPIALLEEILNVSMGAVGAWFNRRSKQHPVAIIK